MLFTKQWWKDALVRAGRTALIFAIPFFPAAQQIGGTAWYALALTSSFGAVTSLVTSLKGLPETSGVNTSRWKAIAIRMVKSFAQGVASGFGTAALLTDVEWDAVLQVGLTGAVGSLILGLLTALPETTEVVSALPDIPADLPQQAVVVDPGVEVFTRDSVSGYVRPNSSPDDPNDGGLFPRQRI